MRNGMSGGKINAEGNELKDMGGMKWGRELDGWRMGWAENGMG